MNPYRTPPTNPATQPAILSPVGLLSAVLLIATAAMLFACRFLPAMQAFLAPRVGNGPNLYLAPAAIAYCYLRTPTLFRLSCLATCCSVVTAVAHFNLTSHIVLWGTVDTLDAHRYDRVHSSWFWAVLPLAVWSIVFGSLAARVTFKHLRSPTTDNLGVAPE